MRLTGSGPVRWLAGTAALGVVLAAAWVLVPRPAPQPRSDAASEAIRSGVEYLARLQERFEAPARSNTIHRSEALQALYLARVESGLGSPFRVIEAALRDPLLADSVRVPLANALLARTMSLTTPGAGPYAIDPYRAWLVDSVVRTHEDPRRGEEVVRVAFELAAAAGSVPAAEATAAVEVAVVTRDAVLARRDVEQLVETARRVAVTPVELVAGWRRQRRLAVEQPVVFPIAWAADREVLWHARLLFERLDRERGDRDSVVEPRVTHHALLRAATRELARKRGAPTMPAVLQATTNLPPSRAMGVPLTDEQLAAAWIALPTLTPLERRAWARALTSAAVRLRVAAQDPVWFEGDKAPTVAEVQQRHGLRAVTFAAALRPEWRGYALLSLDRALGDLRRVMPEVDLHGLRIHLGVKAEWPARALALHDPQSRTIYFPLGVAPGVLAHELGHDLDWQVARRLFGERGTYATDGAARRPSDILAAPIERLTGAAARGRAPGTPRPTEILARHVDWFTAAALASMGRSNGFLSTVQETGDALGNASRPDSGQIEAAVSVISPATRIPLETLAQVHAGRVASPLVREVVSTALGTRVRVRAGTSLATSLGILDAATRELRLATDPRTARRCIEESVRAAGEPEWISDALAVVAEARTRGILRQIEAGSPQPVRSTTVLADHGALHPGPVEPELRREVMARLRRDIGWQLATQTLAPLAQASQAGGLMRCETR